VTFYSQRLRERATALGLERQRSHVIYPPVAPSFAYQGEPARRAERSALGLTAANVLVNVKRLHPLAGQRYLLEAMKDVVRDHPDTHLVICGTGTLLCALRAAHADWRLAGIDGSQLMLGRAAQKPGRASIIARSCRPSRSRRSRAAPGHLLGQSRRPRAPWRVRR
jgi:hypothetical protein